jgi:hypothetical protein
MEGLFLFRQVLTIGSIFPLILFKGGVEQRGVPFSITNNMNDPSPIICLITFRAIPASEEGPHCSVHWKILLAWIL